ncbi:N-lysine methyltransferase setd6 isoform X2 [Electrophorus electricus]|uniref:N-lysine methyltransferase setd6 isoform X2 n=1 Tax=Electrophorus electricus TaxID=8005 RepID=UPI0015CFAC78|nr:N-lysine methyltransferase setd6 isoform X2 [Electrophorus electricus]
MATEAKRPKKENGSTDDSMEDPLKNFLSWCDKVKLTLSNKVYLSKEGTIAEYGMLAKDDIEEGHVLFSVPRHVVLRDGMSAIKEVLEEGKGSLESSSGWVPLILALMYEYTCPESYWRPYLSLWPDFKKLDHPMFWSKEERERLLKGTGIPEAVDTDLTNIEKEYKDTVLPFIGSHPELWDPEQHTLELYQSLVAFVMAYSFQEPVEDEEEDEVSSPPMMVPMADMLNHVSNHNANLEYTHDCLKMVAVREIRKGEEIFNTYGPMASWQLLHMYGFTEPFPTNSNDTADIQMSSVYTAAVQGTQSEAEKRLLVDKWNMLCEMDMVREKGVFVFGKNGSLTDTELYTTLKVLCMSKKEFEEFQENEGWEEDDGDDEDSNMAQALSFEGLPALAPQWKQLLQAAAGFTLGLYSEDVESDRRLLEEPAALAKLNSREARALHVRLGQKTILHHLQQLTQL